MTTCEKRSPERLETWSDILCQPPLSGGELTRTCIQIGTNLDRPSHRIHPVSSPMLLPLGQSQWSFLSSTVATRLLAPIHLPWCPLSTQEPERYSYDLSPIMSKPSSCFPSTQYKSPNLDSSLKVPHPWFLIPFWSPFFTILSLLAHLFHPHQPLFLPLPQTQSYLRAFAPAAPLPGGLLPQISYRLACHFILASTQMLPWQKAFLTQPIPSHGHMVSHCPFCPMFPSALTPPEWQHVSLCGHSSPIHECQQEERLSPEPRTEPGS